MRLLFVLQTALSLGLFPFLWRGIQALRGWARVPIAPPPEAGAAPLVTILVPARNEERSIERCVRSLLKQDYPRDRLRVVVMDDRSTDRTGAILAQLAAEDSRLTVLTGTELPTGWQGKCWALHQAVQAAGRGADYLLFTDADTMHMPQMLSSAVRFAAERKLDLLSLAPGQELVTRAERLLLPTILGLTLTSGGTLAEVNDPTSPIAKAVGQFILFRAGAYEAVGGHEAVRNEIVEDFAIARVAKSRGFTILLADGHDLVRTRMYQSAAEIWEGFSKNAYRESSRGPGGAAAGLLSLPFIGVGPWVMVWLAMTRPAGALFTLQAFLQMGGVLTFGYYAARALGLPTRYALAEPLGATFLWGILANSTWRTLSGRGVTWKGRVY